MKKHFSLALLSIIILFSSCEKGLSAEEQKALDQETITNWLKLYQLDDVAQQTASGIHYVVERQGNGTAMPSITDDVTVYYTGFLPDVDSTVFDNTYANVPSPPIQLSNTILGWQEGIPLMRKNEITTFLIPSHLGYGEDGAAGIPSNSVLIFEVEMLDF